MTNFQYISINNFDSDALASTVRCYVQGVDAVILTQVISMAVAVLAIVWHQQRSTERLRSEMRAEIAALRAEVGAELGGLRADVNEVRERLARIEGFLGIGIPAEAAAAAAGAGFVGGKPQA